MEPTRDQHGFPGLQQEQAGTDQKRIRFHTPGLVLRKELVAGAWKDKDGNCRRKSTGDSHE